MARRKKKDAKLGSVYCRRGVWYIRFTVNGREYRESSHSTDQQLALALLEKRRTEVIERRVLGPQIERTTFDDLVRLIEADYKTNERKSTKDMLGRVKHLRKAFKRLRPVDVSHRLLKEYVTTRLAEGARPATVRYELVIWGRMCRLAVEAELLATVPPLPTVVVRNARQGFFEPDQFERLLTHLPEDLRPAVEFMYITGWRVGEVRQLTLREHIDFENARVLLHRGETKNEEPRSFPFAAHPALRVLIVRQCERALASGTPWLFPRSDGSQLGTFRKAWEAACKEAKLPGKLVHDFRRTAVRNLVRANIDERVAMKLTGHKTRAIFDRYNITSEADLNEAVERLGKRTSEG
ncbi:MAG TPA: site-specific integrase [Candidatus Eisenbacteria bacterium]|nr:site-specific integrase [Candidatus Eisenbacteria bacterium]